MAEIEDRIEELDYDPRPPRALRYPDQRKMALQPQKADDEEVERVMRFLRQRHKLAFERARGR